MDGAPRLPHLNPAFQHAWMALGAIWLLLTFVPILAFRLLKRWCCFSPRLNHSRGRVVLITGSNTGIGFEAALALYRGGATVILACRNAEKAAAARARMEACSLHPEGRVMTVSLDLASFASVRACAAALLDACGDYPALDSIVLNAGRNGQGGTSVDGCEEVYQTNYLGHFLLLQLLLPSLLTAADGGGGTYGTSDGEELAATALAQAGFSRVVCVGSVMHHWGQFDAERSATYHLDTPHAAGAEAKLPLGRWEPDAYCDSKLHLILLAAAVEARYAARGVRGVSVNPGAVASDIWRDSFPAWFVPVWQMVMACLFLTSAQGAETTIAALTAPLPDASGAAEGGCSVAHYFVPYLLPFQYCSPSYLCDPLQFLPFETLGMYAGAWRIAPDLRGADAAAAGERLWAQSEALLRRFGKKEL